jgi:hypothetical protein
LPLLVSLKRRVEGKPSFVRKWVEGHMMPLRRVLDAKLEPSDLELLILVRVLGLWPSLGVRKECEVQGS